MNKNRIKSIAYDIAADQLKDYFIETKNLTPQEYDAVHDAVRKIREKLRKKATKFVTKAGNDYAK